MYNWNRIKMYIVIILKCFNLGLIVGFFINIIYFLGFKRRYVFLLIIFFYDEGVVGYFLSFCIKLVIFWKVLIDYWWFIWLSLLVIVIFIINELFISIKFS